MGLTQSKLAVGDLIFDARLCDPEGGTVVVLHGWPEFSSWWQDSLEAFGAAGCRAVAFDQRGYFPWCQTVRREGEPDLLPIILAHRRAYD